MWCLFFTSLKTLRTTRQGVNPMCLQTQTAAAAGGTCVSSVNSAVRANPGLLRCPQEGTLSSAEHCTGQHLPLEVEGPFFSLNALSSYIPHCTNELVLSGSLSSRRQVTTSLTQQGGWQNSREVFRWFHSCSLSPPLHSLCRDVGWAHKSIWQMFTK